MVNRANSPELRVRTRPGGEFAWRTHHANSPRKSTQSPIGGPRLRRLIRRRKTMTDQRVAFSLRETTCFRRAKPPHRAFAVRKPTLERRWRRQVVGLGRVSLTTRPAGWGNRRKLVRVGAEMADFGSKRGAFCRKSRPFRRVERPVFSEVFAVRWGEIRRGARGFATNPNGGR